MIPHQKLAISWRDLFGRKEFDMSKYIVHQNRYWTGSGRDALRKVVVGKVGVPSFTCSVVYDALSNYSVFDSGVICSYNDVKSFLDVSKVDSLVLPYNFGFSGEVDKIAKLCSDKGVVLIEDCAQALGSTYGGRLLGGFGEHAVYSFGISKNIGFMGGMLASKEKFDLNFSGVGNEFVPFMQGLFSSIFFNKYVYGFSEKILDKLLSDNHDRLDFELSNYAKGVVLNQMGRYSTLLENRRKNAEYCMSELDGVVDFVRPVSLSKPSWLYFVLMVDDRDGFISKMRHEGVDVRPMHTFKGSLSLGEDAAKRHCVFALHRSFLEIEGIVKAVKKVCANGKY